MRPSTRFCMFIVMFFILQVVLQSQGRLMVKRSMGPAREASRIARQLGLADLCLATDARYVRHISVTDPVAPYMDHPGGVEHFPSSSFWAVER